MKGHNPLRFVPLEKPMVFTKLFEQMIHKFLRNGVVITTLEVNDIVDIIETEFDFSVFVI
jgi:hypothetical protein